MLLLRLGASAREGGSQGPREPHDGRLITQLRDAWPPAATAAPPGQRQRGGEEALRAPVKRLVVAPPPTATDIETDGRYTLAYVGDVRLQVQRQARAALPTRGLRPCASHPTPPSCNGHVTAMSRPDP